MPVEPPQTQWRFPSTDTAEPSGLVGLGADMEPGTILAAYRSGIFPMPLDAEGAMGWWSPDPRGVLEFGDLRVSRSLRRATRRFDIRINTAFAWVIDACADPARPRGWIDSQIRRAYVRLHELGWVHSVETWLDDELVGGLYGVAIGGLFAGESMFHRVPDASKAALVALVNLLDDGQPRLIDVQWPTDHLSSLGVIERSRRDYITSLPRLLATSPSTAFDGEEPTIEPA